MALALIVVAIASLWLFHRATQLLKIPAPLLITTLGIEIPDVPNITLDSVTCTSVHFHWAPPEKNIVKFVFQLDGKKGITKRASYLFYLTDPLLQLAKQIGSMLL